MMCSKLLLTEVEEKINQVNDEKKKRMLNKKVEGKEKTLKILLLGFFLLINLCLLNMRMTRWENHRKI